MKLKFISSESLEYLRGRINNKLTDYHIERQQYIDEADRLESREPKSTRVQYLRQTAAQWQYRIEGLREGLNDISLFVSEIEI